MQQKSGPEKQPAEDAIRDIRRATRRHFSAEKKIPRRAGRAARRGEHRRTLSPRGHRLVDVLWLVETVLGSGKKRLAGDTARAATSDEVKDLRREAQALKEAVADLTLENPAAKKRMARPVCKRVCRDRLLISLLQRIRPRRFLPAKMEIRALRSS